MKAAATETANGAVAPTCTSIRDDGGSDPSGSAEGEVCQVVRLKSCGKFIPIEVQPLHDEQGYSNFLELCSFGLDQPSAVLLDKIL